MKLFNTLAKKIAGAVALVAIVAGITGIATAGFGPDRPTKDWNVDPTGFDYVVYNSFINMEGKGDERDFLEGVQVGRDATWTDPINNVEAGEIEVKLYMHNNAASNLNASGVGIATKVNARVELPGGQTQTKELKGFISAENANPVEITDTLSITGSNGGVFELEPIIGTGKLMENGNVIGTVDVAELLSERGVNLANQNGCSEFMREITFRVKSKVASWTLDKMVRVNNSDNRDAATPVYGKANTAQPGDTLDYILTFQNIGNIALENVVIGDRLPAGVTYKVGTTQWMSPLTEWKWRDVANDNLFSGGLDMYDYAPFTLNAEGERVYATAFVRFQAKVANLDALQCGTNDLVNRAFAKPRDYGTIESTAKTTVSKTCEPVVMKKCDALDVVKINRTKFDFTARASVTNATIQSYVFTAKDKDGKTVDTKTVTTGATTANYTFENSTVGDYIVTVVVNTDKGVAVGVCEKTVTVEKEPVTPVAVCKDVKIDILSTRKVKVTVSYDGSPANRVVLKNIEYNFGDGTTPLVTTNNPVEYTYAKDGTYKISVKVTFAVDGVNRTEAGDACTEVITFSTTVEKCPYNSALPKDDAKCVKPKELPYTGATSNIAMFLATSMVGMLIFRGLALRKN